MAEAVVVSMAVEGPLDDAVATRLIGHVGGVPGPVFGTKGKSHLRKKINGYNAAAMHSPWFVLVDLDTDHLCASSLIAEWLPERAATLCFRVVVHEAEAWLLADRPSFASFLGVATARLPPDPDAVPDPKALVVSLARQSRRRTIREDLVPDPRGGRRVGPAYTARMAEFVRGYWDPGLARARSNSLRRAMDCLATLVNV